MEKRALVTGASSGIGAALVRELLGRGWKVALAARRRAALEKLATGVDPDSERTLVVELDVTNASAVEAALQQAADTFGGLDAVVANAGVGVPAALADLRLEDLRWVFEVNVVGAAATLLAGLPHVRRSPRGILVAVSSLAAWRGGPGAAAYNASKAALTSLVESIRPEVRSHGVRLLEVNPGFVRTPMTDRNRFPMPFLIPAETAARRIAEAMERGASHLAFPWPMALAVGLLRRLPDRLFDRLNSRMAGRALAGLPAPRTGPEGPGPQRPPPGCPGAGRGS